MLKKLVGWLAPPTFPDDPVRSRQAAILRHVLLGALLLVLALVAASPLQPGAHLPSIVAVYLPLAIWHVVCFALLRRRWVRTSAFIYTGFLWLLVTVTIGLFGGMSGQNASVYVVVVLLAAFTLGGGWGVVVACISIVTAGTFVALRDVLPEPIVVQGPFDNAISLSASLLLASFIAFMALRQLHQALRSAESEAKARAQTNALLVRSSAKLEAAALLAQDSASLALKLLELRGEPDICGTVIEHIVQATQAPAAAVVHLDDLANPIAAHQFERMLEHLPALAADRSEDPDPTARFFVHVLPRRDRPNSLLVVERESSGRPFEAYLKVAGHQLGQALLRDDLDQRVMATTRLEALGQLSGGVAHDFNNLLLVIQGSAELLEESLPEGRQDLQELAQDVLIAGKRAAELTRKLLTFARPMPDQSAGVDIAEVAQEVHDLLHRVVDSRIDLHLHTEQDLPLVAGPRANVHQVLFNLCINARDAMPTGGALHVGIHSGIGPNGGAGVRIEVRDDGVGMNVSTRRHVFEPFFTTKADGKGTGLGLATVWGIMAAVGGTVDVQSRLTQGSTFTIWWPQITTSPGPVTEQTRPLKLQEGIDVLLVDDDDTVRRAVRRLLNTLGCEVRMASCGEEALESIRASVPDIVVSDVSMPNLDGPDLLRAIRRLHPALPVLFITGYQEREGRLDAPVLIKPFSGAQLSHHISQALHRVSRSTDSTAPLGRAAELVTEDA